MLPMQAMEAAGHKMAIVNKTAEYFASSFFAALNMVHLMKSATRLCYDKCLSVRHTQVLSQN